MIFQKRIVFFSIISGFSVKDVRPTILLFLVCSFSFAQNKQENIGTEIVNVVKPYTPAISDAVKVKEMPVIINEENTPKESVKYTILPFPVASTFSPAKGTAQALEKPKQIPLFKNYATLGIGNFRTLNAELYVTDDLNGTDYVSGMLRHHSSQGGLKEVELDNYFYDTAIDLVYGTHQKEMAWDINVGYQNQIYNWYGLPSGFGDSLSPSARTSLIDEINPRQSYTTFTLGGEITFEDEILNNANLEFNHFSDAYRSSENSFVLNPTFKFNIMEEAIKTKVIVDYVGGSFKSNYLETNTSALNYGFTNLGIVPSFEMVEDDWTLNIGAGLIYSNSTGTENKTDKFYIYPSVTASYKIVGDLMVFYSGAVGNLEQNTYRDFVDINPFVSPTLNIKPTNELYSVYAGLKGKLATTISYDIKGSYSDDKDKALFVGTNYNEESSNANYAFGNSFQMVYDDMKIIRLYGELKADLSKNLTLEIDGTFSAYDNKTQREAWNLPAIQFNSTIDFAVTEKWFAGINLFYVGERKDQQINTDILYLIAPRPITLDGYLDLNANVRFKYSDRFTAYLKANNITNNGYQKWLNYPVQGFQVLVGGNCKFDF